MELFCHKSRDMGELRNVGNQKSRHIKYELNWSQVRFWSAKEEGVARDNSGADNDMDQV